MHWPGLLVPVAVASGQPEAGRPGHQVQLGRPGVPQRHRPQAHSLFIQRDDLGVHPLQHRVVPGHLDGRRVLRHLPGPDPLAPVEPGQVGDEALDDEHPGRAENPRHIGEALGLPVLREQAEQCVEDQIDEAERPVHRHLRHVTDDDGERITTRLRPQAGHHRLGGVHPLDRDPPAGQRERDPAGPDGQLQHPSVTGQPGEELHRIRRVEPAVLLVIDVSPAVTVKRGITKPSHAGHPSRPRRCPPPNSPWRPPVR
jgi:hypothetical protein